MSSSAAATEELIKLINLIDGTVSRIAGVNLHSIPELEKDKTFHFLNECCEIREKLRSAVTLAGAISETNIQCMLHVLSLRQERAKVEEKHRIEVQTLQGRIDSLSSVLQYQTDYINGLSQLNSLSEFWSKVIFPICGVEIISRDDSNIESGLPTSAATAMAHISVYCADQMKVQYEMKEQEMNSNVLLVNIGDKISQAVKAITRMEAEHHGIVSDNSSMRDALTQKNHIIDHLVYRLDKSAEDMEVVRFENEDIRSRLSASSRSLNRSDEQLNAAKRQCNRISERLSTAKEELQHVTALYFDTLGLCKQWQNCFDNMSAKKAVKFDISSNMQRDLDMEAIESDPAEAVISTPHPRQIRSDMAAAEISSSRRSGGDGAEDTALSRAVPPMQWSASTVAPVDETHFCRLSSMESPPTEQLHPAPPTSQRRNYISRIDNSTVSQQGAQQDSNASFLSPIQAKGLFPSFSSSTSSGTSHTAHYQLPTENCLRRLYSAYKERQRRLSEGAL